MLLHYILGTDNYDYLLFLLIYAVIGIGVSLIIHYSRRNPSINPTKFNLWYWFRDNAKRLALNFILILIAIRFSSEFIGIHQGGFTAFLIGVFNDQLADFLQNKGILRKRDKCLDQ